MNFKMCGGHFSFCFLHETVFGNDQIAITHNGLGLGEVAEPKSQIEVQMFKIKNECW